jgi:hypothetical protein
VALGVGDADALAVALFEAEADAEGFEVLVAVGFAVFVEVDLGVAVFVAAGVAVFVAAGVAVFVAVGVALVVLGVIPSPVPIAFWLDDNCGGVIARTAPNPPRVPPAINTMRFISVLSPAYL